MVVGVGFEVVWGMWEVVIGNWELGIGNWLTFSRGEGLTN